MKQLFRTCLLAAAAQMMTTLAATNLLADNAGASNAVVDKAKVVYGVAGHALSRHTADSYGGVTYGFVCPSGTTKRVDLGLCEHAASAKLFIPSWVIVDLTTCPFGTIGYDYSLTTQNSGDGCTSPNCSQSTTTEIFYGWKTCGGFMCSTPTYSWVPLNAMPIVTTINQTRTDGYYLSAIGLPFSNPDSVLIVRGTQVTSWPDPRWLEIQRVCHQT